MNDASGVKYDAAASSSSSSSSASSPQSQQQRQQQQQQAGQAQPSLVPIQGYLSLLLGDKKLAPMARGPGLKTPHARKFRCSVLQEVSLGPSSSSSSSSLLLFLLPSLLLPQQTLWSAQQR